MSRSIDYGALMHAAMRELIRRVLQQVQAEGLPGEHHFFITFDTRHPGVRLADWLAERYPEEMTVVMQYWFEGLEVGEEGFAVTLNFGDQPEPLYIPFDAIRTFVDPSVEFGLRFESHDEGPEDDGGGAHHDAVEHEPREAEPRAEAEVVRLDRFRK
ncbi:MAG: hypothetical protein D6811_12250 [Alphaproteobacteria bacterium]|nr:MAG: hypothetical protein D6811_12250 [Alphaproteobacteria bacterium]